MEGIPPVYAIMMATVSGFVAGCCTGLLNTRLKINSLLAGILMMTILYSVNLRIMGRSNIQGRSCRLHPACGGPWPGGNEPRGTEDRRDYVGLLPMVDLAGLPVNGQVSGANTQAFGVEGHAFGVRRGGG